MPSSYRASLGSRQPSSCRAFPGSGQPHVEGSSHGPRPLHMFGHENFLLDSTQADTRHFSLVRHVLLTSDRPRPAVDTLDSARAAVPTCPTWMTSRTKWPTLVTYLPWSWSWSWSWSPLFNHHLHERDNTSFADPAGCSSCGAPHATCKSPTRKGAHKQPRPET